MRVRVRFFGILREFVGSKEVDLKLNLSDPITVRDVINALQGALGKNVSEKLVSLWNEYSSLLILVNGINIRFSKGLDTLVNDGDEISIFPPGGGG
ncbi:MAG: MoaD family protein [Candidatus Korarchaeota archaeon]|nr:MoaD family protein [Thermoproteota archaeon]MCR8463329.1 MoaD family protein [Thermoproteota archaeon]MCR8471215.1 MoaD family protein [Thermoproteota archaeon]MCR8473150.1 MoaD family protein [Thermoproteota archaeon]MCR8488910.1 MoaD family protein [Thermoproteota archaeon]